MSEQDSCYSNDEEYFMDLCRGNQIEELKDFLNELPTNNEFKWVWVNDKGDNFMHMISANNLLELFEFLLPILKQKCPQQIPQIINQQNSSRSTPLHYAVITDSKGMVEKLLQAGADTQIVNEQNRTALNEAQKFQKFQIAEILAPVTKTDIEALKKQIGQVKLNDDSSDEEAETREKLESIEEGEEKNEEKEEKQEEGDE